MAISTFKPHSKRHKEEESEILKPFDFCCSPDYIDPLTKYNDKNRFLHKIPFASTNIINGSPVLKFQTHFTGYVGPEQAKQPIKNKLGDIGDHKRRLHAGQGVTTPYTSHNSRLQSRFGSSYINLRDKRAETLKWGPIEYYIEDEITEAKDILWEQKRRIFNEELDRNIKIGSERFNLSMDKKLSKFPSWYQDFSIDQMKNIMMLQCVIRRDCEEMVSGRTERMLVDIGIVSTFFLLTPNIIRKLQETSNCDVIKFLREIYKVLTGNYFEEEEYKHFYDCNERIILSAIAFLTLPETIMELHKRLPPVAEPKLPSKPLPPVLPIRQKKKSPYEDDLFTCTDWASYYNRIQIWRARYQLLPKPKIILPPKECILTELTNVVISREHEENEGERKADRGSLNVTRPYRTEQSPNSRAKRKRDNFMKREEKEEEGEEGGERDGSTNKRKTNSVLIKEQHKGSIIKKHNRDRRSTEQEVSTLKEANKEETSFDIARLPNGSKVFDFTINGVSEKPGPVEYKICGVLQNPRPHNKSWLGEKHPHYIVSGAAENPPSCPITYEMTGVANVTPTNSDEKFFAVLKLGDGPKKIYPSGRKNLSPKWQEWLQNVDEEFRKIEREMQKLIKNIEAVTRLVFPGPKCDNCCSCRQSRKSYIKGKDARTPYFVIDTIAEDSKKNKCIIGSMAMHSPAPTPPESTVNLLEVIASEDVLTTKLMINGITNSRGETQYYISGITDEIIHQPSRIVERPPPAPPRNVPPCECAIQQISAKGLTQEISHDHIPWTKEDGLCFGKKFRPHEAPAVSCKMYPGDKSCRRNPFYRQIVDMKRRLEERKRKSVDLSEKKRMYSIADFPPCGDEHGMSICGAPWGRLHTLTPQELEELEKLRKQILRGPPCGTKPGRAVCKGPFGERIPRKKPAIDLKEIPGEFDEDEEEEEEEEVEKEVKETKVEVVKEKERKRDQKCLTSPDILASKQETKEKKAVKKFIPDPLYPGYDDTWNIHRTAPSKKESETDFKALLKLSSPKPPATPAESKSMMDDREKFHSPLPKNTSKSRKDTEKIAVSRHAKSSETHSSATNQLNKMSTKRKKKSNVMKDTREIDGKSLGSRAKSEETVFDKSTKRDETRNNMQPTQSKVDGPRTKGNGKATVLVKQIYKNSSLNSKTEKRSFHGKPSKKIEAKSKPATGLVLKQARDNESKISKKSEKSDNKNRSGTAKNKSSPNKNSRVRHEREKGDKVFNLSKKKHRRKDSSNIENESIDPRKQILDLKKVLMSPDNYPPNVKPVDLPEELQTKCAHEYGHLYTEDDSTTVVEETAAQLPSKGPCGWRTKSEQQLPTKKTMVYLCEPDYPPETIQVREGGKPCVCRENRAKKKVLMYNIGGLVRGKKDDTDHDDGKLFKKKKNEEDKKLQVIEGIIYHTPPLSPRRSDEYVPEYDLYKSPYDMCLSKRTDENLKYLERFGVPKISASKTFKQNEPCGCNESVDGQDGKAENEIEVFDKNRRELVKGKPPKERWELALKDIGLIDYYTRCRDSMPCWLKCRKFNRTGCGPSSARLVVKRPVCECKYERKILENQEEKIKWKERREKLKSLKKQPFINIENTSRPVVADTKLMISGVKRIPREDEYIDDVKYSITGVVENYTEEPPKPIVSGVRMATPIQTPEPSVEEIPCVCLHRHWSPINIPPGPLPKPEELQRAEDCKRKMATEEAYRQIHVPDKVYDSHGTHSCDKTCNSNSVSDDEGVQEEGNGTMLLSKMSKQRRRSNGTSGQISKDSAEKRSKLRSKSDKSEETMRIIKHSPKKPEQKEIRDPGEKTDIRRVVEPTNSQSPRRTRSKVSKTTKTDSRLQHGTSYSKEKLAEAATDKEDSEISYDPRLMTLVKNELSKLATEGFLFAKLPKCFLLPQLRYWLMYRKGIALSNADRDDSVRKSIVMWNSLDVGNVSRIEPPSIGMTKVQLRKLTFDDAERIKEQIIKKKAIFYSQVRKDRVLYARSMWNTMDYGKFPDTSFKEAYFTYMASKEADGYVFKPWLRSDTRNVVTNSLEKKVELHIMEISRAKKQSILRWSDHFDTRTLKSANASFGRNGRMDFESPDVEKEFPGLYASESAKKSNESDFSDEGGHEKHSKKELLGGKRKEKKDRKDRGYATLEGESSPDEDQETKSPSKSKKTKAFKFPSKKEKREKSREKETKEKDVEKEKDKKKKDKDEKDVDKEKRKEKEKDKAKQKLKDRKKGKHTGEDCLDIGEAQPVFGVSLHLAVDRSRCHDGVELPLVVRDCIDFVEENGMSVEALYKVPGVKSKVQYLKKLYNNREHVNISEFEPTVATSLLILFLRELPEPVLENSETISRFEQAASTKDVAQREGQLIQLTQQLPECNKVLLAWVILHLDHVTAREKTTKMNAQTISMTLSPVLQMSHRLLLALLFHCKALFPNVLLTKYVPPLSSGSVNLPDTVETIAAELSKQESLLSQIHKQMNAGFVTKSREEQLWEVQRVITQLKRKYKTVQKMEGATQKSLDEEVKTNDETIVESNVQKSKVEEEDAAHVKSEAQTTSISTLKSINKVYTSEDGKEAISINSNQNEQSSQTNDNDIVDSASEPSTLALQSSEQDGAAVARASESASTVESEPENVIDKLRESLIYEELLNMQALLKSRINQERNEIKRLTEMLSERGPEKKKSEKPGKVHSPNEAEWTAMIQLVKENQLLEKKMTTLIRSIIEEKDACIELRVQLAVQQLTART